MSNTPPIAFSGNPRLYRRQAILLSFIVHVWIYVFFVATKYIGQDENWLGVWQLPAFLLISAVVTAWMHYRWVMRLDAQYGKGSGWELKEVTVKLPILRERR